MVGTDLASRVSRPRKALVGKDKDVIMDDRYENQVILGWRSPRATALGADACFVGRTWLYERCIRSFHVLD